MQQAGLNNFAHKVVIDVTNPLDFSSGMPPSLLEKYCNTYSLGEEVQKLLPDAKNTVRQFLSDNFQWKAENILDFGDMKSARLTEAIVPFWVSAMQVVGPPMFNYLIVK